MVKIKFISLVLLLFLLVPLAIAISKPIAGKLEFEGAVKPLTVSLYAEVNSSLNGKQICVINPLVKNGPDGSFATNLDNLVFKDMLAVRCNSLWKAGDKIWYEVNYGNNLFKSNIQQVELGTGLQFLESLRIPSLPEEIPSPPSPGAGGGGAISLPKKEKEEIEIPSEEIILKPKIFINLSAVKKEEVIEALVLLKLLNEVEGNISLKLVLFSLPNEEIVKIIEDSFLLKTSAEKKYRLNLNEFNDGWYKLQAFVYFQEELTAASNIEKFFIKRELIKEKVKEKPIEKIIEIPRRMVALPFVLYGLSFLIVLIVVFFILARRKRK